MSSSSSLNYEGWATAASLITVSDCPSVGVSQMAIAACARYEEEGHFSLVSRTPFLHENNESARSDWLEKKETFHDLASQNRCNARDGWGCTDGALYVAYSILAKKTPDSLTCWLVVSHTKSIFSIICPSAFLWINYMGGVVGGSGAWIGYLYVSRALRGVMCVLSGSWFELVCLALSTALAFVPPVMNCGSLGFSWSVS